MNLQTSHLPAALPFGMMVASQEPAGIESVVLRHLKTHEEIEAVLPLRDEINLSALNGAADFHTLEKKETKSGLSSLSSLTASSSGRSASFPWATSSR
ncbi:hypothetical protein [Caenimonas aquaedulcis]|uniref:Uncharacterized protein n=1 Tax=Caenimonas aquaedulcis TaxID=2793270 RepID=A0A931H7E5_9BURK|nr:hypothetical protein [Caenimonas aquaedulcis]MBG9389745.1 hypothetical protein [Caenimonas aquaedulcis]